MVDENKNGNGRSYKEHLSYVLAKLEDIHDEHRQAREERKLIRKELKDHMGEEETKMEESNKLLAERFDKMDKRFDKIEEEISLYRTIIKTLKLSGAAAFLILTFKFGDVKGIWQKLMQLWMG